MTLKTEIMEEIETLIAEGKRLLDSYGSEGMSGMISSLPESDFQSFAISAFAAIERIAGRDSEYYKGLPGIHSAAPLSFPGFETSRVHSILGALQALRDAVANNLLVKLEVRIRALVHDDFMTQAKNLLESRYHIAAMTLIGGVLEDWLLRMCIKNDIEWNGTGNISKYNNGLKRADVYEQSVWRRIQSIGDLRNDAAHGKWDKVACSDVEDAHGFVQRFVCDYQV